MQRHTQSKEKLLEKLSAIESDWRDEFSLRFIEFLSNNNFNSSFSKNDLKKFLDYDFEISTTLFRLSLEQSKDEFKESLKIIFRDNTHGSGKSSFKKYPVTYLKGLEELGVLSALNDILNKKFSWKDIFLERLKAGRGSAIKGQKRGKFLEDFVEDIVVKVFSEYEVRKSFIGANGRTTAKADFCIPSTLHPNIVIEVKAYGATGSKQSDVIGDVKKIINEKRNDTFFLLVTDGVMWANRMRDFERLIEFQNLGEIYRIYTQSMKDELESDLKKFKDELNL